MCLKRESSEGEFLGYAIYHCYDERSCELGWVLKPAFWHKGYADEMTDLLTCLLYTSRCV